jgi:hypothetical protein
MAKRPLEATVREREGEMHVSNDPIPKNRMRQFHEILCATGGRYTSNPRDCGDVMRVDYAPGDYRAQNEAWRRVTAGVTEVRKDQWWRRVLRRMFSNA